MAFKNAVKGTKNLEIIMRDVIDGLEEMAIHSHFHSGQDMFEILSIEKPGRDERITARVIPLPAQTHVETESDIVEYLIQREMRMSA